MKLHSITLHNIKSLQGTYLLNLDERFGDSELFLIHGPTGIGKTTIFDAVALSLFGQTPKLNGGAQGDGTNSVGWVMNELSGECWTELIFSILEPSGERKFYQARWELHRAGKQANGAIQHVKRKLYQLDEHFNLQTVLIESKVGKEYTPVFSKALHGMTYEDFQQTILLPQNGFTQFIEAAESERTILLERLTGTMHLAELCKQADIKRKRLQKEVAEESSKLHGVLSAAEVETTRHSLEVLNDRMTAYTKAKSVLDLGQDWEHHRDVLVQKKQVVASQAQQVETLSKQIVENEQSFRSLQENGEQIQQSLASLQQGKNEVLNDLSELEQAVMGVSNLKAEVQSHNQQIEERAKKIRAIEQQISRNSGVSREDVELAEANQEQALTELRNRVADVTLDNFVARVNARKRVLRHDVEQLGQLVTLQSRQATLKDSIQQKKQDIQSQRTVIQTKTVERQRLEALAVELQTASTTIAQRLDKAKEFFVWHQERVQLTDGQPCKLCGSTSHPLVEFTSPERHQIALNKQQELEAEARRITQDLFRNQRVVERLKSDCDHAQRAIQKAEQELQTMERNFTEQRNRIQQITLELTQSNEALTSENVIEIRQRANSQSDQLDALTNRLSSLQSELTRCVRAHSKQQELLHQKEGLRVNQLEAQSQLQILQQNLNAAAEQVRVSVQEMIARVNAMTQSNCAQRDELSQTVRYLRTHVNTTYESLQRSHSDWQRSCTQLTVMIEQRKAERARIQEDIQAFQTQLSNLEEMASSRQDLLQSALAEMETLSIQWFSVEMTVDEQWQSLKDQRISIMQDRTKCEQQIASAESRIKQYEDNLERMKRIDLLKEQSQKWTDMHTLLNTTKHVIKDPKNGVSVDFRRYAQIRQLQLLVEGANEHLNAMQTDYLIQVRKDSDKKPTLDFEVTMGFGTDCARPLTTLSGGQTFLVSLAFALALADLRKVDIQIETLLIDEGFGALDRNYVEMAVDTLEQLKHKGVQVGLISHVVALQEKIAAAVTVEDLELASVVPEVSDSNTPSDAEGELLGGAS
jgi:exonuclease SbcC